MSSSTQQETAARRESVSRGPGAVSSPRGRKRSHPSDAMDDGAPPNVKLPTANMLQTKQMLYKKVAEAERSPFFLHPHQVTPIYPFLPFPPAPGTTAPSNNPQSNVGKFSPGVYPVVQQSPPNLGLTMLGSSQPAAVLTPPSSVSASSTLTTQAGMNPSQANSATSSMLMAAASMPPRPSPYATQFYGPFVKCPVSPPTPSGIATLSVLSPWNVAAMSQINAAPAVNPNSSSSAAKRKSSSSNRSGIGRGNKPLNGTVMTAPSHAPPTTSTSSGYSASQAASGNVTSAPILPQHVLSPHPGLTSIQSPLGYLHPSPLSPMMLIHSPYTSSVSSCPSVSSSSGCSSEGSGSFTTGLQRKHYAPSEYHVGPRRPLSEKLTEEDSVSEGANSSGRNTPVDAVVGEERNVDGPNDNRSGTTFSPQPGNNRFTPFAITSQGPSITHSSAPNGLMVNRNSSKHASAPRHELHRINSVDLTCQAVSYPYSVESGGQSLHPLSVDSHGYVSSVLPSSSGERPSSGVSSMSSSLSSRESTPDAEEAEPIPSHSSISTQDPHVNNLTGLVGGARSQNHTPCGSDTFCLVPGRLSLLSSTQKYKVTVDEVRRRLSHPECLNASVLGGILRRAKSKNGGHVLRQRLDSIGLSLPPGRRKATELSLLTSLVEGEATHLSSDFRRICETYFPHGELAQIIARQHVGTPQAQHRVSMVKAAQLVISELQAMLNAVGGPSNIKSNDPNNPYPGLTNFSLLTHGFGNPAINTSLSVVQTYLQELLSFYDGRKPIQPENRFVTFGSDKVHTPFGNGMPHPGYAVPNANPHPALHHSQSTVAMKQEPLGSPRNSTL